MEWLNYHHLLYFWMVAREGSVAAAAGELRLAPQTVSGQIHRLEHVLGARLLRRQGRHLVLTDAGRVAFGYAEDIFALGRELTDVLRGKAEGRPRRLVVGVADVLPKLVVRRFLEPAFALPEPVQVICREDKPVDEFVADLALHKLDVVLSDSPVGTSSRIRVFNHLLGECGTTFLAVPRLAVAHRRGFPRSLHGAPCLLPGTSSTLHRGLDEWLHGLDVRPRVVGEFDDSALMYAFGQDGKGIFAAPTVVEHDVRKRYRVHVVGRTDAVRHRFYAISAERTLKHPAVVAISRSVRGGAERAEATG
jgi:LysR family transcriptional activator of nhaA